MASPGHLHGHLDANADREVVYCHACSNEWYRDGHGLICPDCHSEVTEIVRFEAPLYCSIAWCAFALSNTI
jgi:Zn finger protein HypA/HybF involved in hydrogenase expression